MPFKPRPTAIHKHVELLLEGGALKRPPVWLSVVKSVPPHQNYARAEPPSPAQVIGDRTRPDKRNSGRKTSQHSQKHLKRKPLRPHVIVYPEDRLRQRFYRDHPHELKRPALLIEGDNGLNREDYSKLILDGMHPSEVTGESVIRYQLHLMTVEHMPEQAAYAKATSEFYEIRQRYEEMVRSTWAKAKLLGVERKKLSTERTMRMEAEELEKSFLADQQKFLH